MEEGSSADQVAVVEADRGSEDLCVGTQQGALPPALTLDPAAVNVTETQQEQQEVMSVAVSNMTSGRWRQNLKKTSSILKK